MATVELRVPPLAAGDKLTKEELLRRWEAHPEIKLAELIGGLVFMPPPLSVEHGDMDNDVGTWLGVYKAATPGTAAGNDTTTFLLDDVPQHDVNLRILPEFGGKSWVEDKYLHGIPELLPSAEYGNEPKSSRYRSIRIVDSGGVDRSDGPGPAGEPISVGPAVYEGW
jgi:hypothetical protein